MLLGVMCICAFVVKCISALRSRTRITIAHNAFRLCEKRIYVFDQLCNCVFMHFRSHFILHMLSI